MDLVLDDGHRPRVDALAPLARDQAHPSLDIPADAPILVSITIIGGAYHEVRRIFAALPTPSRRRASRTSRSAWR